MSSRDSNAATGDSNSNLDSAADEKTKDSIISQESQTSQNSSKISENPMEPHDGVLDFEEDGPEPADNKDDDADSRSQSASPSRSGCGSSAGGQPPTGEDNDEVSKDGHEEIELPEEGEEKVEEDDEEPVEKVVKKKRRDSDLEDGEVTDSEDDEGERFSSPSKADKDKPAICRFFSRGQCTWGNQCRFIHPGMQPGGPAGPMTGPIGPPYGGPPPHPPHGPPPRMFGGPAGPFPPPHFPPPPMAPVESAWERGLRNAKEMLKEANRRREEDPAFEDRKLHQGLQASPVRDLSPPRVSPSLSPPLRSKLYGTYERHRELPRSLSPINIDRLRQERHAVAERERARAAPGDMWRDPWMRSKSPIRGRQRRRSRSWSSRSTSSSSGSSYSSSRSSSYSRSRSRDRRRNYGNRGGPPMGRGPRGGGGGRQRYPSERGGRLVASPSPPPYRRGGMATGGAGGGRGRRRSSSSSSSSSRSRSPRRRRYSRSKTPEGIPRRPPRQVSPLNRPIGTQIKMNLIDKSKKLPVKRPFSASPSRSPSRSPKKLRVSPSPPPKPIEKENKDKKKDKDKKSDAAKRDELMRQLKAVEDAIAKKKAKT